MDKETKKTLIASLASAIVCVIAGIWCYTIRERTGMYLFIAFAIFLFGYFLYEKLRKKD